MPLNSRQPQTLRLALTLSCTVLAITSLKAAPRGERRVAVVELEDHAQLTPGASRALTDSLRGHVAERLGPRFTMITRENIYELVGEEACDQAAEARCEVELGRRLSAHYVISGAVTQLDGALNLALRVHHTRSARLLGVRERDAHGLRRLKEVALPQVARSASALIAPELAGREEAFNAELEALMRSLDQAQAPSKGSLKEGLARLEQEDMSDPPPVKEGSDAEYQRALKRLEREAEALRAHRLQAAQDLAQVERIAQQSAQKGEVAARLFMKVYGAHRLGNPLAQESQRLLERAQRRQAEGRRAQLIEAHREVVERSWQKAKPLVQRGDSEAEAALLLFLKAFADHPMGNPLEAEARALFSAASGAHLSELHVQRAREDWAQAERIINYGGARAVQAIELFLERYQGHPLGNPLRSEALAALEQLRISGGAAESLKFKWVRVPVDPVEHSPSRGAGSTPNAAFLISEAEVTVAQYRQCVEAGWCSAPHHAWTELCNWGKPELDDHPINCVDWGQARTFAKWVGPEVELPTGAEWERAARGARRTALYPWGGRRASCRDAVMFEGELGCGAHQTAPVCSKPKSGAQGQLCDMSGNLWEWTLDAWSASAEAQVSAEPPQCRCYTSYGLLKHSEANRELEAESEAGEPCRLLCPAGAAQRVTRGGGYDSPAADLRLSARRAVPASKGVINVGFRLRKADP